MLHRAALTLLVVIVVSSVETTSAWAGGGDYPAFGNYPAFGYPYAFSFNSERECHLVQRRLLTRHGWRLCPVRICG
jgi:hypothetical protein